MKKHNNSKAFAGINLTGKIKKAADGLKNKLTVFKIVAVYAIVGGLWIFFSDKLLVHAVKDLSLLVDLQIAKGWFFVIGTSTMLYMLISRNLKAIEGSRNELKLREEQYRLVIDGTTDGLWDWDLQTNYTYLSPAWKQRLGYEDNEISNTLDSWKSLVHSDDIKAVLQNIDDYVNGINPKYKSEYRAKKKDGSYIWVLSQGQAIWDNQNRAVRIVGTHTDITERKKTELVLKSTMEENKKLLKEALEYDQIKTEFFSNISHEFKTPLNVILGTIQLMYIYRKKLSQDAEYWNKVEKHLGIMKQNCYRLLRLVNNLMDITRIDSGFIHLNLQNYNIVYLVEQITLSVVDYAANKSISLTFDTDVEEKIIACDADVIERVMLNLLSNAIKYTKTGGSIWVNIYDRNNAIQISVQDTGIGIPENKQPLIFERFRQVNSSLTRENEGSGIGLSLIKSLIEVHGGTIRLESEYGKGSNFIVEFPADTVNEKDIDISVGNIQAVNRVERAKVEFSDIYT